LKKCPKNILINVMGVIVMAVTLAMIYKKTPSCKGDFFTGRWDCGIGEGEKIISDFANGVPHCLQ
jgi:hypothetical protein